MKNRPLRPRIVRAGSLFLSFALILLVYSLRLVQLQILQHSIWKNRSDSNHRSKRTIDVKRGTLYDRNGAELAISVENYTVFLYPREIKSLSESARTLSTVLPLSDKEIFEKAQDKKGYFPIFRNLERKLATKLISLDLPGVHLEESYKRVYPQNRLASNLLGFCGRDGHGLEGVELSFDKTMRGYPGLAVKEDVTASNGKPRPIRVIKAPAGGSNIYLTIDSFIQHLLESELEKLVKKYDPIDATAIVMDPHSGEILGMACYPSYDLNKFFEFPPESHRNRLVVDFFEPGSCMKIFAVGAGLKFGKIDSDSRFYCRGYSELFGKRIKCHGAHGLVDVVKAISESCNSAMIQIGQMVDSNHLYRMYRELGFGEPSGIDVPSESQGLLKPPSKWSGLTGPSISIGQEIAVTGVQLVTAYSAIANGGYLMRPRLIKRIESNRGDLETEEKPKVRRQVFSPQVSAYLRRLLLGVVESGTGDLARLANYTICGKTSTAQKANPKGGYFMEKVVTSFVGFSPAMQPRIVLLVAVNEPKGDEKTLFGGKVAAPAFATITDRLLKYLKVPPDKFPLRKDKNFSDNVSLAAATGSQTPQILSPLILADFEDPLTSETMPRINVGSFVPDFRGLSLSQVASISRHFPTPVILAGNGIAIKQKPEPGFPLEKTENISVEFSTNSGK